MRLGTALTHKVLKFLFILGKKFVLDFINLYDIALDTFVEFLGVNCECSLYRLPFQETKGN